ncbi:putative RDD family membrane protein YckC [Conyzicola lurida]|uniref:Putative RDD family membrane protein YckC n=1 Tax=Conyzicola lurida TaxID=1172621 RepID=A0A841ANF3_9MICO|nr:RDD family protein [Conyzicola lurida]MBB5843281.1 putative RDD family membrane protein YckC [Conyzicola lurida]
MPSATPASADWPGQRLGLPERGPRSIARGGRRLLAIVLDWVLASAISVGFFPTTHGDLADRILESNSFATLGIFAVLQIIFIATLGGSVGHLVFGMRVVPLNPAWVGVFKPAARTVLLCLFIPAVIWDRDHRGLHDRLVGTVLVRR